MKSSIIRSIIKVANDHPRFRSALRREMRRIAEEENESGGQKGKKLDPETAKMWQEFMDEKYEGGRKMVPNPDKDSKRKEIQIQTAMKKDPALRDRIRKEFGEWMKKRQESSNQETSGSPKEASFEW